MDSIDRQIRRFQSRPAEERQQTARRTQNKAPSGQAVDVMGADGSKESAAQPSMGNRSRTNIRADSGNDIQGEQWRQMEQRGHCGYLSRNGGPGQPSTGRIDVWEANDFVFVLTSDVSMSFHAEAGDGLRGTARGNIQISRAHWFTIEVITNGFTVNWQNGIYWPLKEKPDQTPVEGCDAFLATFRISRVGTGDKAIERVYCTGFTPMGQVEPAVGEEPEA